MVSAAPASAASSGAIAWGLNGNFFENNGFGQLGDGRRASSDVPVTVLGLSDVTSVSAGGFFSLALLSNGTVMSWGEGGELGDGSPSSSDVPVMVSGLSGVAAISAGYSESLALLKDGNVMGWGPQYGSDLPVVVTGLSGVSAVAAGTFYDLALLKNGTVMFWDSENGNVPVAVSGLSGVTAISGSYGHALALLKNGTVMEFLGKAPAPVSGLSGVTAIAAGWENNLALLSDGTVMTWSSKSPVPVSGLSGVTAITVGHGQNLALLGDGTIMAWGENRFGQLGNGTTEGSAVPILVSGPHEAAGVSAGYAHSLAYGPPLPTIIHVNPNTGPVAGDTSVTISAPSGSSFIGATAVKFGSTPATGFTVNSPTSITAVSPAGAGRADVTVTTPAGTNPVTAADQFNYVSTGLPELGRCQRATGVKEGKVTTFHGVYTTNRCTTASPTQEGKFEWATGPGAKANFTGTATAPTLEFVNAITKPEQTIIHCAKVTYQGTFTGSQTLVANVTFTGCEQGTAKTACQSIGAPAGEIKDNALEGELGVIKGGATPSIGWDLRPTGVTAPFLAEFECGGGGQATLEGSVIAAIAASDVMAPRSILSYKGRRGLQIPESFEGGLKDTLFCGEQVDLTAKVTLTNEEPLEIKALP
jgi:alpha-tubulin suppressor-like RCC1 family protein